MYGILMRLHYFLNDLYTELLDRVEVMNIYDTIFCHVFKNIYISSNESAQMPKA